MRPAPFARAARAPRVVLAVAGFAGAIGWFADAGAFSYRGPAWLGDEEPRATLERADSLRAAAERAKDEDDRLQQAWDAARALSEIRRLEAEAGDEAPARIRKEVEKLLDDAAKRLGAAELASVAGWWGATPALSIRYARALEDARRRSDTAAEGLAFLARYPDHDRSGDAAKIARRAEKPSRYAGGLHHSVYRVAALVPLSGSYELYGRSLLAGLVLGVEEESALHGLPIRVLAYDTEGEPAVTARRALDALAAGSGVLVGEVLSVSTFVLAGIAGSHGVPLFSPSATEERVGEVGAHVFQTGLSQITQGRALARHAVSDLGLERIALAETEASGSFVAGFRAEAEALGARVFGVPTPAGARDYRAAVNELKREEADALLLPVDEGQAQLWAAALRSQRHGVRLLGSEAVDPENLHQEARGDFDGLVMAGLEYALPADRFERVDSSSEQRFGVRADRFVRRGYLTGRILGMALRAGVVSPAMMVESVSQRLVQSPDPEHPAWNFVRWGEAQAQVPIYVTRRGTSTRVR